ncbi:bifunctional diguanylate cyclase/phosphodiesterase [uncultured Sphingomonas sp.]|uniref:putative bifunctional diguanylate cyclase/phosphodiesterase n=1 Tax=uncultured Sphingomonas sp. TaxID=158754 RepID=UPI0025D8E35D|nr:bifunctional diguanylate cyclase/phosphodiesterase [uncultured Sphingomonas sp.]
MPLLMASLRGTQVVHESANKAFIRAQIGARSSLDPIIREFLLSKAGKAEHEWQSGGEVERRHFRVCLSRVTLRNEPVCIVSLVDQTAEVRTEETLRREMTTDSLTGLPNRSGFTDALDGTIASHAARWAVLMVDLERFSRINACLGSMAGDELLITVARRIKGALRTRDVLARTGGDEFGILLAIDERDDEAQHVAKRLQAALATPFQLSEYEIRVTSAIGIAFGDTQVRDPEDVIRHAQVAMKKSKSSKKAEAYQTRALDSARAEFAMETALRRAIDNGELTLRYQPICNLATGRVESFEALARWSDEYGVQHQPSDFIRVAEESGLIVPLGRWAIDAALATLAAWDRRGASSLSVKVGVNVSPIQLQRDSVPDVVEHALAASGMAGDRLKLELTESALITEPARMARMLTALKSLGLTIAMDDFGTGFSNLASLQKLPIDVLKIDRSFITGMLADRDKIAIVRAILSLSQALSMTTVAEGIETHDVAQTLAALGCQSGQGYAFAHPLEAEDAYAFLLTRNG